MRKIRRRSEKLIAELKALRESRGKLDDFGVSFLFNFYYHCSIAHTFDPEKDSELSQMVLRQYHVFLVSCWETFFRDVFVYVNTTDEESMDNILGRLKPSSDTFQGDGADLAELLSKSFNFQNLEDLNEAYDGMWGSTFLEYICNKDIGRCGVGGNAYNHFSIKDALPYWLEIIERAFSIRHQVVHDANCRVAVDLDEMQKTEFLFLILPQVANILIADRFKDSLPEDSKDESWVPAIVTTAEILGKWQKVED